MAQKNQTPVETPENAVSKFESLVNQYGKLITWICIAAIVIVAAVLAYNRWVAAPARQEAQGQMYTAEHYFVEGDYEKALNGDGNHLGFAQVIDEYGAKAGQSVYLYAGISALHMDLNQEAIDYLKKYKGKDKIQMGRALCCTGDAYVNLEEYHTALGYYYKAAAVADNAYRATYLAKAALVEEELGNDAKALELYEEIEIKYAETAEGLEAAKNISRIQNK